MSTHKFTRQELYELVWSEPMSKLSKRYGISDRGLAKACARANIPVPERGYWAKVQAGQKIIRPPLPAASGGQSGQIAIAPPGPPSPRPEPPPLPESVQEKITAELQREDKIVVPQNLSNPHRIVGAWLDDEKRERSARRRDPITRRLDPMPERSPLEDRRLRILSALFTALESRGFRLQVDGYHQHDVKIEFLAEQLEIHLSEYYRQYRRYFTEEERRTDRHLSTRQKWTQVKEPTGQLLLEIKPPRSYGWSGRWQDQPSNPLEEQLNTIIAQIAGGFETLRLVREKQAEEQRARMAAEQLRQEKKNERKREAIRLNKLVSKVTAWQTSNAIREFVNAIGIVVSASDYTARRTEFEKWSEWALREAAQLDPTTNADLFDLTVTDTELWSFGTTERSTSSFSSPELNSYTYWQRRHFFGR